MFSSPIAFSIPEAVSATLGTGFPTFGFMEIPLVEKPPNSFKSKKSKYSSPYPKVPEAAITGLSRTNFPRFTVKSTFAISY